MRSGTELFYPYPLRFTVELFYLSSGRPDGGHADVSRRDEDIVTTRRSQVLLSVLSGWLGGGMSLMSFGCVGLGVSGTTRIDLYPRILYRKKEPISYAGGFLKK